MNKILTKSFLINFADTAVFETLKTDADFSLHRLKFFSNNGAAFVCELMVFMLLLTALQTVMNGGNKPSTELQTD